MTARGKLTESELSRAASEAVEQVRLTLAAEASNFERPQTDTDTETR